MSAIIPAPEEKQEVKKTSENHQSFLPVFTPPSKRISFSKMKSHIFKELRAKRYKGLAGDLEAQRLSKEQIKDFFVKEGYSILYWAVTKTADAGPLSCLCDLLMNKDKIDGEDVLQTLLLSNSSKILQDFLFAESGSEIVGSYNSEREQGQIEKFKCLLRIDRKSVEDFIVDKISAQCWYLTNKIKTNFKLAQNTLDHEPKPEREPLSSGVSSNPLSF